MRALADVVFLAHATFTLAMLFAWVFLPWQVMAAICGGIALVNAIDGECPVTRWEFRLRRRATRRKLPPSSYGTNPKVGDVRMRGRPEPRLVRIYSTDGATVLAEDHLPSESVMARLLRVVGIHATPVQVQRLMLALLVLLPTLAYLREVMTG